MIEFYEYKSINVSTEPSPDPHGIRKATIESAANRWAQQGWRTVSVMPSRGQGYADAILIERKNTPVGILIDNGPVGKMVVSMEDVAFLYPEGDDDNT